MSFKSKAGKELNCSECSEPVKNVGADATGVICWKCVSKSLNKGINCFEELDKPEEPEKKD